jgi:hypothetical protein
MSAVASAPPSPLSQIEPGERATVIRTLREHLPPAEFDAVLTALAGRPDEITALPHALQDRVEVLLLDAFDDALGAVVVSTLGINNTPSDAWLPQLRARFAGLDVDAAIAEYRAMQHEQAASRQE